MSNEPLELADVRAHITAKKSPEYWRSLDELAGSPAFEDLLKREFPSGASEWRDPASRRAFLKVMGAALALGGLSGCQFALKQPQEKIVPYVRQPELVIPGKSLYFATSMLRDGFATGLLVESHEGRPTKIEGNPDHGASFGSTDLFAQGSILTLYDPDRSQSALSGGKPAAWDVFVAAAGAAVAEQRAKQGAGLRILTGPSTSPTLAVQIGAILTALPQARWVQYAPISRENAAAGARQAFGSDAHVVYQFSKATAVVALDSDFMSEAGSGVRYSREIAVRRKVRKGTTSMLRLYVAEPSPSNTGNMADHRLPARASQIETLARAIAAGLGVAGATAGALSETEQKWVTAAVADLKAAGSTAVVVVGNGQPAAVHAIGHAINRQLGANGTTVLTTAPLVDPQGGIAALAALTNDMNSGAVDMLLISEVNPAYDAPRDVPFADALGKVKLSVHHGLYNDETAAKATWHIPAQHYLEMWSDARAFDGTASIVQPLVAPLYDATRSLHDIIGVLGGTAATSAFDTVRAYWQANGVTDAKAWEKVLNDGLIGGTTSKSTPLPITGTIAAPSAAPADGFEVIFRPDPTIYDGSYANNAWLQETPKPYSKVVWDNPVYISPKAATQLGVTDGDMISIAVNGGTLKAAVWTLPGQAEQSLTVHLGYGRSFEGRVAKNQGFNGYSIRSAAAPWFAGGAQVTKTGEHYDLASTQGHFSMEGRDLEIIRRGTIEEFTKNEEFIHEQGHHAEGGKELSLLPGWEYKGYAWGMSIDMNACNGCNACLTACQSENNIATVTKAEVLRGREMLWLRIDQYYTGDINAPQTYNMVMLCQQCENAPCEIVCPVAATVHDSEGLNNMVYNRCVGTKYCSNNCPYKVRRFNFLQYADDNNGAPTLKMQKNPDVTVRPRGVMEKCTFCVQRINEARINADREKRTIADGEIITACQQVCPTQAIAFGNINDPQSAVSQLKGQPHTYISLGSLNTRPRVSYLAKMKTLNAELGSAETEMVH